MKEVRLDLFKLNNENDRGKGRIKVLIDKQFYRNCLKEIRNSNAKNANIAQEMNISYFEFMKSLENNLLPIDSLAKLISLYGKRSKLTRDSLENHFLSKIKKIFCNSGKAFTSVNCIDKLTEDLCKICGAIATDGTLHLEKNAKGNGYLIELSDFYETNVKLFCHWLQKVFGIKANYKRHRSGNYFETRFKNKIVFRYLSRILGIPIGKKSKFIKMPEIIKNSGLNYKKAFVTAALLFDGGVIFKSGYYQFSSKSLSLIKDVENVLIECGIKPDHVDRLPDKNEVYRLLIRNKDKLKKVLTNFLPPNSTKYSQLNLHINGFEEIKDLNEVMKTLNELYPRFGKSLIFSDIINLISDGELFVADDLVKKLGKSKQVIKKSLNKLEKWNVLSSNKSKGRINKVWSLNQFLK